MPIRMATLARVRLSPLRRFREEVASRTTFSASSAELGQVKIALKA
jgi:hypothetical protein